MANVLIRDLDDRVLAQLKSVARANGRSLQAEIHDALQRAAARTLAQTKRLSAQWQRKLRRSKQSDSTELLRQSRESR